MPPSLVQINSKVNIANVPETENAETVEQRAAKYIEPFEVMDRDQQKTYLTKIATEIGSLGLERGKQVIKSMQTQLANIATTNGAPGETVLSFRNNEIVLKKYSNTTRAGKTIESCDSIPVNFSSPVPPGDVRAFATKLAEIIRIKDGKDPTAALEAFKEFIQNIPQTNREGIIRCALKNALITHALLNPEITTGQIKLFNEAIHKVHLAYGVTLSTDGALVIKGLSSQPDLIQKADLDRARFDFTIARQLTSFNNEIAALAYKDVKDFPGIYSAFANANKDNLALVQASLKMALKEQFRLTPDLKLVDSLSKYNSTMKNMPFKISFEPLSGTVQFQTKQTDETFKPIGMIKAKEYFSQKKLQAHIAQMADRFVDELGKTDLAKIGLLIDALQGFMIDNLNIQLSRQLIININDKQNAIKIKGYRGRLVSINKICTTIPGDSDASIATDTQFTPIYNLPPEVGEILSKLICEGELKQFDDQEKQFALAVLLTSPTPESKAWAAYKLQGLGIKSFSFIDFNDAIRKIEIEVLPHGIGKRFYVNVYATDNASRKRIFLRAIKYEDESYRQSAFAQFYCPIWMKLIGKSSYLSGKALSFEPEYGITNDDLNFDLNKLQITSSKEHLVSTENILIELLEPFYRVDSLSERIEYKWKFEHNIIDAINSMDVEDRDAYFEGKLLATESNPHLEALSEEDHQKYDFYKTVYSDLMMNAASDYLPLEQKILELEVSIRSGIDSIPHQVFKLLSNENDENKFDQVLSFLVNMEPGDIEYAQDRKLGPPLRVHLKRVLNTFLDDAHSETLLETFENQIGLTNVSRWIITDRVGEMRNQLKQDLKALVAKKADSEDFIELLSTALADSYFQYYLSSNPTEVQKISKLLIEGMGETNYNRFLKPLLEP